MTAAAAPAVTATSLAEESGFPALAADAIAARAEYEATHGDRNTATGYYRNAAKLAGEAGDAESMYRYTQAGAELH